MSVNSLYHSIANLDVVSSVLVLIAGFVIVYLSFSSGAGQYGMGLAFIAGASVYLLYARKNIEKRDTKLEKVSWNRSLLTLLNIIFLFCFSASLYILYQSLYFRPLIYFILVTIAYLSIFIEIFYINHESISTYLNIFKVILLSLSFRAGIYFEFPTVLGTDTQFHLKLANVISKIGHVPSHNVVPSKYIYTPLWHIFVSSAGTVLGVSSLKMALFLSIVIPFTVIISLFTFLIVRELSGVKAGLIAVLFVNISDMLLVRGLTNINTSSLVHCLFILSLFCFMREKNKIFSSFVILSIFDMIYTHQLSTFCVLIIFFSLLTGKFLYNLLLIFFTFKKDQKERKLNINATVLIYFVVLLILRWSTMGERITFLDSMLYRLKRSIFDMLAEYTSADPYVNVFRHFNAISNILYNLGYSMLIGFAIVGLLLWLNRKHVSQVRFSCIIAAVTLFIVIYPLTYIGLGYLFIPHRFISFLEIFLVMFAAYSVYMLYKNVQLMGRALLFLLVVALIFFMLTTPYVNRNDTIYCNEREYREEWTYSEIISLLWAINHSNDTIYKDALLNAYKIPTVVHVNLSDRDIRNYPTDVEVNGIVIVRSYLKERKGKVYVSGTFGITHEYDWSRFLDNITKNNNLISSTDGVEIYRSSNEKEQ